MKSIIRDRILPAKERCDPERLDLMYGQSGYMYILLNLEKELKNQPQAADVRSEIHEAMKSLVGEIVFYGEP